jgi:hypothetical protein
MEQKYFTWFQKEFPLAWQRANAIPSQQKVPGVISCEIPYFLAPCDGKASSAKRPWQCDSAIVPGTVHIAKRLRQVIVQPKDKESIQPILAANPFYAEVALLSC